MIDGSLTKVEIINLLGPLGGGGVVLDPLHPERSGGIVVNYTHVFEKCDTFQVWRVGNFSSNLSTEVNYHRNKEKRLHLCVRLLNELEGDRLRSSHLIQATLAKNKDEKNKKKENESKSVNINRTNQEYVLP